MKKNNIKKIWIVLIVFIITYIINMFFPYALFMFYNNINYRDVYDTRIIYKDWELIYKENSDFIVYVNLLNSIYWDDWIWKTIIIIPFILKYIDKSWPYEDYLNLIYKKEDNAIHWVKNIKIILKIGNWETISIPIINENQTEEFDYSFRPKIIFPIENWRKINSIEYIIEFDWIIDWKTSHYTIKNTLNKEKNNFFWLSLIYLISQR
jgi:hypothetical protein